MRSGSVLLCVIYQNINWLSRGMHVYYVRLGDLHVLFCSIEPNHQQTCNCLCSKNKVVASFNSWDAILRIIILKYQYVASTRTATNCIPRPHFPRCLQLHNIYSVAWPIVIIHHTAELLCVSQWHIHALELKRVSAAKYCDIVWLTYMDY